jgi:hypothetical protein
MTRRVQGSSPLRWPFLESASKVMEEAAIIPSTDTSNRVDVHDVSPYRRTSTNMCLYDSTAAIPAKTTTLRVVVHRMARSAQQD